MSRQKQARLGRLKSMECRRGILGRGCELLLNLIRGHTLKLNVVVSVVFLVDVVNHLLESVEATIILFYSDVLFGVRR